MVILSLGIALFAALAVRLLLQRRRKILNALHDTDLRRPGPFVGQYMGEPIDYGKIEVPHLPVTRRRLARKGDEFDIQPFERPADSSERGRGLADGETLAFVSARTNGAPCGTPFVVPSLSLDAYLAPSRFDRPSYIRKRGLRCRRQ